ncbi:MAG: glycosyltransferase 87 family protein [Elusimicrobia bacterium]|nr:glycosyltransferase 87 family protein [Elusimicrobiota bacterium]
MRRLLPGWLAGARDEPMLLLLALGVLNYLCAGLFLGVFSNGFDFSVVHEAAVRLVHGQGDRIYDAFLSFQPGDRSLFFLYPPITAVLFSPLALLPEPAAWLAFQVLSHTALWAALAVWLEGEPDPRLRLRALLLFLFFQPLYLCLQIGQSETIILLCLMLALRLEQRGKPCRAGLCLAAAVCLKLFLAVLIVPLLARRRWRAAACCLAALLAAFLVGGAFVPWPTQARYWSRLASPFGLEGFWDNQSLTAISYRLMAFTPYTRGLVDAPALARALAGAAGLAALAACAWACRRASPGAALALGLTTAVLISPHSDTHHQGLLLLAFLALPQARPGRSAWLWFYAFFAQFQPLVAFKFLSRERLDAFAAAPADLLLALPALVLLAFWLYCLRLARESGEPAAG